ncbi:hypothetical protein THASP1DRAFT_25498 [Thamnocephalis sphaerospora]|uniref:DUF1365-domain-containing protein n=1 Tax=Thamnocephalis sphaerospora TaxID=78915 RepID=A0A4P9XLH1_9FUNG|nr:hypothetical protein THASP1DRAFT_25498 [Thamnocephalis sphaerospora]|eukprot:RKP06120.1 hypothetical protein THASP1DRAFT_25498 [Thamnocephalis sphaerospora]
MPAGSFGGGALLLVLLLALLSSAIVLAARASKRQLATWLLSPWTWTVQAADGWSAHRVYLVRTRHTRFLPVRHSFAYSFFYFGLDLDALDAGRRLRYGATDAAADQCSNDAAAEAVQLPWWFDHNCSRAAWWRPISINTGAYLGTFREEAAGWYLPLKEKLFRRLVEQGIPTQDIGRVELVTTPALFGYAMNPASIYYCYESTAAASASAPSPPALRAVALEVHNTFGEIHLYAFDVQRDSLPKAASGYDYSFRTTRTFHVSPFNPRDGDYQLHVRDPARHGQLDYRLIIDRSAPVPSVSGASPAEASAVVAAAMPLQAEQTKKQPAKFAADVRGPAYVLNAAAIIYLMLVCPLDVFLTMPRILYEAWRLAYRHYLPVFARPDPMSSTVTALPPSRFERHCMQIVHRWLDKHLANKHVYDRHGGRVLLRLIQPCAPHKVVSLPQHLRTEPQRILAIQLCNYQLYTRLMTQRNVRDALLTTYATGGWHCVATDADGSSSGRAEDLLNIQTTQLWRSVWTHVWRHGSYTLRKIHTVHQSALGKLQSVWRNCTMLQ